MQIEKRINNNVVLAKENEKQFVLIGSGIGFHAYPGEEVDMQKVEKRFYPAEGMSYSQMSMLMKDANAKELKSVYTMIKIAKERIPEINDNVFFSLLDHLTFCVKRADQNMTIISPLEWEVKKFYQQEYDLGLLFLDIVKEIMNIDLPKSEATFFALHLVNAQLTRVSGNEIFELTEMTNDITKIVKYHFQRSFDENSLFYNRFITHIRYYLMRLLKNEQAPVHEESIIFNLKEQCLEEYECVEKIDKYLYEKNAWKSTEAEKMYLILHIHNLVKKSK